MNAEPCLDQTTIEKLTRLGGAKFVEEMVELFLSYVPQKLAAARTAVQAGDLPAVGKAVHPIKSSAANIGANTLGELAARIEALATKPDTGNMGEMVTELEVTYQRVETYLQERRQQLKKVSHGSG